jgi:hypothetical protein
VTADQSAALVMKRRLDMGADGFCCIVTGDSKAYYIRDQWFFGIKLMEEAG